MSSQTKADIRRRLGKKRTGGVQHAFSRAANVAAEVAGYHWTFGVMLGLVLVWLVTGPIFGFSDTWQLAINTATTVVTFLMVFIIQNTQNRDAKAMHLKLDELLRAVPQARKAFMDVEEEDLAEIVDRADPYPPEDKQKDGEPKPKSPPR